MPLNFKNLFTWSHWYLLCSCKVESLQVHPTMRWGEAGKLQPHQVPLPAILRLLNTQNRLHTELGGLFHFCDFVAAASHLIHDWIPPFNRFKSQTPCMLGDSIATNPPGGSPFNGIKSSSPNFLKHTLENIQTLMQWWVRVMPSAEHSSTKYSE